MSSGYGSVSPPRKGGRLVIEEKPRSPTGPKNTITVAQQEHDAANLKTSFDHLPGVFKQAIVAGVRESVQFRLELARIHRDNIEMRNCIKQ